MKAEAFNEPKEIEVLLKLLFIKFAALRQKRYAMTEELKSVQEKDKENFIHELYKSGKFRFVKLRNAVGKKGKGAFETTWNIHGGKNYSYEEFLLQDNYVLHKFGILTGYKGLFVIDVDDPEVVKECLESDFFKNTLRVKTQSGNGMHFYFRIKSEDDVSLRESKIYDKDGDHIADLKYLTKDNKFGEVVGGGSETPDDNGVMKPYLFANENEPTECMLLDIIENCPNLAIRSFLQGNGFAKRKRGQQKSVNSNEQNEKQNNLDSVDKEIKEKFKIKEILEGSGVYDPTKERMMCPLLHVSEQGGSFEYTTEGEFKETGKCWNEQCKLNGRFGYVGIFMHWKPVQKHLNDKGFINEGGIPERADCCISETNPKGFHEVESLTYQEAKKEIMQNNKITWKFNCKEDFKNAMKMEMPIKLGQHQLTSPYKFNQIAWDVIATYEKSNEDYERMVLFRETGLALKVPGRYEFRHGKNIRDKTDGKDAFNIVQSALSELKEKARKNPYTDIKLTNQITESERRLYELVQSRMRVSGKDITNNPDYIYFGNGKKLNIRRPDRKIILEDVESDEYNTVCWIPMTQEELTQGTPENVEITNAFFDFTGRIMDKDNATLYAVYNALSAIGDLDRTVQLIRGERNSGKTTFVNLFSKAKGNESTGLPASSLSGDFTTGVQFILERNPKEVIFTDTNITTFNSVLALASQQSVKSSQRKYRNEIIEEGNWQGVIACDAEDRKLEGVKISPSDGQIERIKCWKTIGKGFDKEESSGGVAGKMVKSKTKFKEDNPVVKGACALLINAIMSYGKDCNEKTLHEAPVDDTSEMNNAKEELMDIVWPQIRWLKDTIFKGTINQIIAQYNRDNGGYSTHKMTMSDIKAVFKKHVYGNGNVEWFNPKRYYADGYSLIIRKKVEQ